MDEGRKFIDAHRPPRASTPAIVSTPGPLRRAVEATMRRGPTPEEVAKLKRIEQQRAQRAARRDAEDVE